MTVGFPNFYIVGTFAQSSQSFNYSHVTKFQTAHAAKIVAKCKNEAIKTVEVTKAAEDRWLRAMSDAAESDRAQFEAECTPDYFNNKGKADGGLRFDWYVWWWAFRVHRYTEPMD
ncbi:hypothetical protein [Sphingobium chlorophenolicum]|uniref:hypothetical protein n=1 Tax=Sphingobium chlorophenolicum TaxID=46429 RepID=UPI00117F416A|nr:hypothetical protein [Sphingobium chlorophenolicum]